MASLALEAFHDIEGLPSLPAQMLNVLNELGRVSSADYNIVRMIQYDAPIAGRVLKAANASIYGYAGQIASLQQAAGLLGPAAIRNLVLTTPILERFGGNHRFESRVDYAKMWLHSSVTAALAGYFGKLLTEMEADACFTAGLVCDIGKLTFAVHYPKEMTGAAMLAESEKIRVQEAEKKMFGFCHADVAGMIAARWGYPQILIDALVHGGQAELGEAPDPLAKVIHLAKYFAVQWGYDDGLEPKNPVRLESLLPALSLTHKDLDKWEKELKEIATMVITSLNE